MMNVWTTGRVESEHAALTGHGIGGALTAKSTTSDALAKSTKTTSYRQNQRLVQTMREVGGVLVNVSPELAGTASYLVDQAAHDLETELRLAKARSVTLMSPGTWSVIRSEADYVDGGDKSDSDDDDGEFEDGADLALDAAYAKRVFAKASKVQRASHTRRQHSKPLPPYKRTVRLMQVPNKTDKFYLTCSCMLWQRELRMCRHILAVKQFHIDPLRDSHFRWSKWFQTESAAAND